MKRVGVISLIILVALFVGMVGCGQRSRGVLDVQVENNGGDASENQIAEEYDLPIVDEPFTLVFATVDNPDVSNSYTKNLPVFEELEKRTGVQVEFEVTPGDQYNTTMQTRLAAASGLPDLIRLPDDPIRYAKGGLIVPIDELIGKYAPNIQNLFKERPEVKKALVAPDNKIYTLSAVVDARSMVNLNGIGIRKDWLDNLDLEEPDTIEEWFEVLKAFKEDDPNGNGENDEIPIIAMDINGLYKFAWSYGLHLAISDGWYPDEDGNVTYEWIDSRMKDWLIEMNKWHEDGLLDPDMTSSQNRDKFTAKAIGDIGGVSVSDMTMQFPQWNEQMVDELPDVRWEGIVIPEGPNGDRMMEKEQPTENIHYAITRDCQDSEVVIRWLDYMFASEDGQILLGNFGIEGLSYVMEDGKPKLTDFILKHERGSGMAQNELGVNGNFPRILMEECIAQRFHQYEGEMAQSKKATEYYVPSFPRVLASKEETDLYTSIMSDIDTYKDEMVTKFITGLEPIENFAQYVESIEAMGIDEATSIKQDQYDRYMQ